VTVADTHSGVFCLFKEAVARLQYTAKNFNTMQEQRIGRNVAGN
jgi:hypothetical protein